MDSLSRWAWMAAGSLLQPPPAPSCPFPDARSLDEFLSTSLDGFYVGSTPTGTYSTVRGSESQAGEPKQAGVSLLARAAAEALGTEEVAGAAAAPVGREEVAGAAAETAGKTVHVAAAATVGKEEAAASAAQAVGSELAESAAEAVGSATAAVPESGSSTREDPSCVGASYGKSGHTDAAVPAAEPSGDGLWDSTGDSSARETPGMDDGRGSKAPAEVHVERSDSLASSAATPTVDHCGAVPDEQGAGRLVTEEGGSAREESCNNALEFQSSQISPAEVQASSKGETGEEETRPANDQTRSGVETTMLRGDGTRPEQEETRPKKGETRPKEDAAKPREEGTRPLYAYSSLKTLPGACACTEDSCSDANSDTNSDTASEQSWASEAFSSASLFEESHAWVGTRETHSLVQSHSYSQSLFHSRSELSSPLWGPLLSQAGSFSGPMAAASLGKWAGLQMLVPADACTEEMSDCGSEAMPSGFPEGTKEELEGERRVMRTQTEGAEDTNRADATELPQRCTSLVPLSQLAQGPLLVPSSRLGAAGSSQLVSASKLARSFQAVPSSELNWEVCLSSLALLAPEAPSTSGAQTPAEGHVAARQAGHGAGGAAPYQLGGAGSRRGLAAGEASRSRGRAGGQGPRAWPSLARIHEQQVLPPSREALLRTATCKWSSERGQALPSLDARTGIATPAALANPYVSQSSTRRAGAAMPALQEVGAAAPAPSSQPLSLRAGTTVRVPGSATGSEPRRKLTRAGGTAPRNSGAGSGSGAAKLPGHRKSPLATGSPLSSGSSSSVSACPSVKWSQQQRLWGLPQGARAEANAEAKAETRAVGMGEHIQIVGRMSPAASAGGAFGQAHSRRRSMSMRASAQSAQPAWKY